MTNNLSLKNLVWPSTGKHAIDVMALAVEWSHPLKADELISIAQSARKNETLMAFLPTEKRFPGFEVKIEEQAASVVSSNVEIVDFIQNSPDGHQTWALSLRPEFFSCACSLYTRWAEIKPQTLKILKTVASAVNTSNSKIKAFGLQYSDTFKCKKEDGLLLNELIRKNSSIIPSSALRRKSLWHSHNGWYSNCESGHRVLNIFNIELVEDNELLILKINGQHRIQAIEFQTGTNKELELDSIETFADQLHIENKLALQNLLSDYALELINFSKVEEANE